MGLDIVVGRWQIETGRLRLAVKVLEVLLTVAKKSKSKESEGGKFADRR